MAEASNTTVTLQVHRFTPRPERAERARGGSPFAKKGSPFGGGSDSAASSGCRSTRFPRALRILCWIVC